MSSQLSDSTSEQEQDQIDTVIKRRILALAREIGDTRYEVRRHPEPAARWKEYAEAAHAGRCLGVITPSEIAVAARVGRLLQVRLGGSRLLQKHAWEKAFADANFEGVDEAHVVAILEETWLRFYTHLRRLFPPS